MVSLISPEAILSSACVVPKRAASSREIYIVNYGYHDNRRVEICTLAGLDGAEVVYSGGYNRGV